MNNDDLKRTIKKICPFVKRYEFYKNTIIYKDENEKKHVIKSNENNILDIYNYLNSRGFGYLPRLEYCDDKTYYIILTNEGDIYLSDNNDFMEFANMIIDRSMYDFDTKINENDYLLTLSTCYNKTDRMVIHAKLIKKETK